MARRRRIGRKGRRAIEALVNIVLLSFLAVVAIGILRLRNLLAAVMLSGIYSLLSAGLFVALDAVDVAFTEAAVGGGIATMLMLGTLALTTDREKLPQGRLQIVPLLAVIATGALLIYGTLDMPSFGDPAAPIHQHVAPRYIADSERETSVPNIVTAILASYRGFDTMGELAVIFTAGIGVMLLLGAPRRRRENDGEGEEG
jgi:multicomponent Na+:H+ antiporter subunit B